MGEAGPGLIVETIAGTAATAAFRATALDHEIRDHPMEAQAVVVAAPGEVDEIRNRDRRLVRMQFHADRTLAGGESGGQCAHEGFPGIFSRGTRDGSRFFFPLPAHPPTSPTPLHPTTHPTHIA